MLKNQTVDCRSVTMEAIITFLFFSPENRAFNRAFAGVSPGFLRGFSGVPPGFHPGNPAFRGAF